MIAGVPGAGISAFFYLLAVLAMPFVALYRTARTRSLSAGRWRLVARQLGVACGIAMGLLLGGVAVGLIIASASPAPTAEQAGEVVQQVGTTLGRLGFVLGVLTLLLVVVAVQLAAMALRMQDRRAMRRRGRAARELEAVAVEARTRR